MKFNIVFFGIKEVSEIVINHLIDQNIKLDLIVGIDEFLAKKHHVSGYKNIEDIARINGIDYLAVKDFSFKDQVDIDFFAKHDFDLGICNFFINLSGFWA